MATAYPWLKPFRTLHLYLGVFTAPALLFIAFTGGLQSVNLHEAKRGGDYKPPAWIASIAHMHKKQSFDVPVTRAPPRVASQATVAPAAPAAGKLPAAPQRNLWPMKIFFVLVSLSLLLSTLTGLYMAWRYSRDRRRYGAALAAGFAIPALLMLV